MQQLIKITSEPMRMVRFSQNARLISSDSVDMERRKAIARQSSFRNSAGQGTISVEDIKKINRTFSTSNVKHQVQENPAPQIVSRQKQVQVPAPQPASVPDIPSPDASSADALPDAVSLPVISSAPAVTQDISVESGSNYTAQRGAFEMRVAKGELTYLPPMVMTIITQRPEVHVEYLGDFNYVPPRDGDSGSNVNLFT